MEYDNRSTFVLGKGDATHPGLTEGDRVVLLAPCFQAVSLGSLSAEFNPEEILQVLKGLPIIPGDLPGNSRLDNARAFIKDVLAKDPGATISLDPTQDMVRQLSAKAMQAQHAIISATLGNLAL